MQKTGKRPYWCSETTAHSTVTVGATSSAYRMASATSEKTPSAAITAHTTVIAKIVSLCAVPIDSSNHVEGDTSNQRSGLLCG